ncbi:MAG: cobalamin-dependent protein [Desulfarculaceae bacterium]|jgi:5-methyltetrahydrofolate--homocysteine methyltransferase
MSAEIFEGLRDAIIAFDSVKAKEIATKGIEQGLNPLEMIESGIRPALDVMGQRFEDEAIFLPELMLAAKAADAAVTVLEPELVKSGSGKQKTGKVLIATVKGDLHDIGKNIVALLLKSAGFEVIDLGIDRAGEDILEAALGNKVDMIGLSALLTTTMPAIKDFLELLEESGHREQFKVIIGGAPITQEFADTVGVDGYGADATGAVHLAKRLLAS